MSSFMVTAPRDETLKLIKQTQPYRMLSDMAQHFVLRTWIIQHQRFCRLPATKLRARYLELLGRVITKVTCLLFPEYVEPAPEMPVGEYRARDNLFIVGWMVHTTTTIHYAYVRPPYRNLGLTQLMGPRVSGIACTHWNKRLPLNGLWLPSGRGQAFEYVGFDPIPQPNRKAQRKAA